MYKDSSRSQNQPQIRLMERIQNTSLWDVFFRFEPLAEREGLGTRFLCDIEKF